MTLSNRIDGGMLALRVGLAFVFIFFGLSQWHNPGQWTGFLPSWIGGTDAMQMKLVLMNATFEIVAGALLLIGAYTRIAALLLALHLLGIAFTIGMTPLGVRDIGLSVATLTLAIIGAGAYAIDSSIPTKETTV